MQTNRRSFIRSTGTLAAGATLLGVHSPSLFGSSVASPNDAIQVALIGCKNHGFNILKHHLSLPNVVCAALCDVDANVLDAKAKEVETLTGKKPKLYTDYRRLLEDKDVQAVIIGTPDHWHCLQLVDACAAGKDVYVEKPMANTIEECNIMARAARKYNRIVQVGQQQRSGTHWKNIMEALKKPEMGTLRKISVWGNFNYGIGRPKVADSAVPAGIDFNQWLGPAPDRTFNEARFHGSWRMFWDYGGGLMSDWGVHLLDMALWAKNIDYAPLSVSAIGGNLSFPDHARETPDTLSVIYQMKDFALTWDHTAGTQNGPYDMLYGLAFICDNATIVANRDGWKLKPEWRDGGWTMETAEYNEKYDDHLDHVKNCLDCIRERKEPNCPVETGRIAALYAHMGNIAYRTGERVHYDFAKNAFNTPGAEGLRVPNYRKPYQLPVI